MPGVFEHFPYTNYHELNLDWVIEEVKRCVSLCENVEKEIDAKVAAILTEWLNDGTIADLINVTIFSNLEARVSACEAKLAALSETPRLLNEVKLAPVIYDDSVVKASQGMCADPSTGYLYSWEAGTFPNGKIHVYDMSSIAEVQTYNNVAGYHANDMEKIGDLIYIAQTEATSGVGDGNNLLAFNVSSQAMAAIRTFPCPNISGVASIDDNDLLILGGSSALSSDIDDYFFYRYDIASNAYAIVSMTSTGCPLFTATQGTYFDRARKLYHMLVVGPDMILTFRYDDDKLVYVSCTKLSKKDFNGIDCGEFEAIASIDGSNLYVSHMHTHTDVETIYTLGIGLINLFTGYPAFVKPLNWHEPLNSGVILYCDASYTGLYEDGSSTYPMKKLSRAVDALNFAGRFMRIEAAAGSYGNVSFRNRRVIIDCVGAVVINKLAVVDCEIYIQGPGSGSLKVTGECSFNGVTGHIKVCQFDGHVTVARSNLQLYDMRTTRTSGYPISVTASVIGLWWVGNGASLFNGYAAEMSGFASMTINQVVTAAQINKPGANWTLIRAGHVGT